MCIRDSMYFGELWGFGRAIHFAVIQKKFCFCVRVSPLFSHSPFSVGKVEPFNSKFSFSSIDSGKSYVRETHAPVFGKN